jgi:uncharacterized protein YdhG (YjbR/CyaY superfamily)
MQYSANNPSEYLSALESDWRKEKLLEIREMILHLNLEEGMEYKMLNYRLKGKSIFHLNAQKGYVSLYVGNIEKVPESKTLLEGFNLGKGCVRISKSQKLEQTGLHQFIQNTVTFCTKGGNTDC